MLGKIPGNQSKIPLLTLHVYVLFHNYCFPQLDGGTRCCTQWLWTTHPPASSKLRSKLAVFSTEYRDYSMARLFKLWRTDMHNIVTSNSAWFAELAYFILTLSRPGKCNCSRKQFSGLHNSWALLLLLSVPSFPKQCS